MNSRTDEVPDEYDVFLRNLFCEIKIHTCPDFNNDLTVVFSIDAKLWHTRKKQGQLGQLYGVDLGNFLYREGQLKRHAVPIVADSNRARNGKKTITVTYRDVV